MSPLGSVDTNPNLAGKRINSITDSKRLFPITFLYEVE